MQRELSRTYYGSRKLKLKKKEKHINEKRWLRNSVQQRFFKTYFGSPE